MNVIKEKNRSWLYLLIIAVVPLLVILVLGSARAHYEEAQSVTQYMQYQGSASQVYLLSSERDEDGELIKDEDGNIQAPGSWEILTDEAGLQIPGVYVLDFLMSNGKSENNCSTYDQQVSISLFVTVGIEDPEEIEIILTDGRSEYTAVPMEVKEGSVWYRTYGPGWLYRFYTEADEELAWPLPGGVFAYRQMTLTVTGAGEHAAALSLFASTRPGLN